ncbi:hypothetical protein [Mycobacterium sp. MMS18-G62]
MESVWLVVVTPAVRAAVVSFVTKLLRRDAAHASSSIDAGAAGVDGESEANGFTAVQPNRPAIICATFSGLATVAGVSAVLIAATAGVVTTFLDTVTELVADEESAEASAAGV